MITIHLICNAHIDPVWLWPWQAGLDEALATCRSVCDRLDSNPDVYFTRGEAWIYEQVEHVDPELFERIRGHIAAGRWEIVGGWYIQPDCNLPSGFGLERQIEIGRNYFQDRFGQFPRIAYNVDSFGHAATLPGMMRAAGQDRYIMMRPQEHEMKLPARLFRWRGYDDGPEVLTFRIGKLYNAREIQHAQVEQCLAELPEGVTDTMLFFGFGDHGGGPTEWQIKWCREHENAFPGARLTFSSPSRFFEAVERRIDRIPIVTGELQQHAVGCYSVYRPVKTHLRLAEHALRQTEIAAELPGSSQPDAAEMDRAWKKVCFQQFHDTLGGSCIPSAYPQVLADLGYAQSAADLYLQTTLRRRLHTLPDDTLQRCVFWNVSDGVFDDYVEFEPWLDLSRTPNFRWEPGWRLIDGNGQEVPCQVMQPEAHINMVPRLLTPMRMNEGELLALRVDRADGPSAMSSLLVSMDEIASPIGTSCRGFAPAANLRLRDGISLSPQLHLIEDLSDTWSHDLDRYSEGPAISAAWNSPVLVDKGPLMASLIQTGIAGGSALHAEWRIYLDRPFVELKLRVTWTETHKILKLVVPVPSSPQTRIDGIPGGSLTRPNDGREMPLRDFTLAGGLGVVMPDVYAADATPERLRITLLRSATMAHPVPHGGVAPRAIISDRGDHTFRFRFYSGNDVDRLDQAALGMQRPPLMADLTRGMPAV